MSYVDKYLKTYLNCNRSVEALFKEADKALSESIAKERIKTLILKEKELGKELDYHHGMGGICARNPHNEKVLILKEILSL